MSLQEETEKELQGRCNKMAVTQKMIAELAGVARQKISEYLKNPDTPHLSREKKELIGRLLREKGYCPNFAAQRLRGLPDFQIGIVMRDHQLYLEHAIFSHLIPLLEKSGYRTLLIKQETFTNATFTEMAQRGIRGLIFLVPCKVDYSLAPMPCIALTQLTDLPEVVTDFHLAGREAVKHLYRHGHRKIAYVQHKFDPRLLRGLGYREQMERFGLEPRALFGHTARELEEPLARAVKDGCTAFFCTNDFSAALVIHLLQRKGIRIPEEAAVIGFDGLLFCHLTTPSIATFLPKVQTLSELAIQNLLSWIKTGKKAESVYVPAVFCPGGSCGCETGDPLDDIDSYHPTFVLKSL